jgi:plasmid stability protein
MDPLQAGVTAARHGQQAKARTLLKQALQSDQNNEPAWLWLSTVVETDAERQTCLERALTINPQNQNAHAELERLLVSDTMAQGRLAIYQLPPLQSPSDVPSMPVPDSATANPRPVRRLPPHLAPAEEETPPPYAPLSAASLSQSGPLTALALTGCLSVTAVSGLLVLSALWLIGWPP